MSEQAPADFYGTLGNEIRRQLAEFDRDLVRTVVTYVYVVQGAMVWNGLPGKVKLTAFKDHGPREPGNERYTLSLEYTYSDPGRPTEDEKKALYGPMGMAASLAARYDDRWAPSFNGFFGNSVGIYYTPEAERKGKKRRAQE
jgi:hypothetical protein